MLLLFYDYVDDILTRRDPHRPGHLDLLRSLHGRRTLLMAGAFADPVDGALFVFSTDDQSEVERFVQADPYVAAGLVTSWRIRKCTVAVGAP
jgi:uncharacterized protein